jgi:formylglycine-generating enzyme
MSKRVKTHPHAHFNIPKERLQRFLTLIVGVAAIVIFLCIPGLSPTHAESMNPPASSTAKTLTPRDMVCIPAGEFTMGTDDPNSFPNERPAHRVKLDGFWIDEHDVTNAEFRKFVDATGYKTTAEKTIDWEEIKKQVPPGTPKPSDDALKPGSLVYTPPDHPVDLRNMGNWWTWTAGTSWNHPQGPQSNLDGKDNYPVVQVCWDDAVAYAKWAGKRLPTEAEWEYAARGGAKTNTRYIWGNDFRPNGKYMANTFTGEFPYHNTAEDGFAGVAPVKSFPPNGYGLYDMAGNVWQWTADLYRADAHTLTILQLNKTGAACCINPTGPTECFNPTRDVPTSIERVTKGGSFLCNPSYCESYRPTARRGTPPDTGTEHIGFRCVMDVSVHTP